MKSPFSGTKFKTFLSYFLLALAIIIAYKFIMNIHTFVDSVKWVARVISPFISGLVLAYILNIPCGGFRRLLSRSKSKFLRKREKVFSILAAYLLSLAVLMLAIMVVVPSITQSVSLFAANFQSYYKSAQDFIVYISQFDTFGLDFSMEKILGAIRDFAIQKIPSSLAAISDISTGVLNGFIALISSVYILSEKDKFKIYLKKVFMALMPDNICNAIFKYTGRLNANCKQYIYTQTIDGCILGTIATIELLVIRSPYALVLGIMLGIVNYVPYFGSIFGSMITVLVVAFTQDFTIAAILAAVLLITQQIDANIIQPRLMSGSFSLSPLLVIVSITIGGAISGIIGMIIAIPIVAVVKDILDEIILLFEAKRDDKAEVDATD